MHIALHPLDSGGSNWTEWRIGIEAQLDACEAVGEVNLFSSENKFAIKQYCLERPAEAQHLRTLFQHKRGLLSPVPGVVA